MTQPAAARLLTEARGDATYARVDTVAFTLDTDGVPYFEAGLPFMNALAVLTDTDGVPYFDI